MEVLKSHDEFGTPSLGIPGFHFLPSWPRNPLDGNVDGGLQLGGLSLQPVETGSQVFSALDNRLDRGGQVLLGP